MRLKPFRGVVVVCAAALAACASTPPAGKPGLHETVSALSGEPAAAAAAVPQVNPRYVTKGYRARVRGKKVYYCRYDTPTASNIRSETCLTEQQLQREEATTRAVIEAMQQPRDPRAPPEPRRN